MAGTINYLYDPNQAVYVIDECDGKLYVTGGTVLQVKARVLVSGLELSYDIRLEGNRGTKEFEEADVFPDKTTAVTEYETRLL